MVNKRLSTDTGDVLRRRAEQRARAQELLAPELLETLSLEQTRAMLHDLQVHRVELEMQNDQLFLAQLDLEVARERALDLCELAPLGYCTLAATGTILHANLTAARLLGVSRQALIGAPITRFIFPEDQDLYYLHNRQDLSTPESRGCELRLLRTDQGPFWARLEVLAVVGDSGQPESRLVFTDISEQKRLVTALAASEARLRAVTEAVGEGVVSLDPAGRISAANPAIARIFGYSREELIGMELHTLLGRPGAPAGLLPAGKGKAGDRRFVLQACRKDGEAIAIELLLPACSPQDGDDTLAIIGELSGRQQR